MEMGMLPRPFWVINPRGISPFSDILVYQPGYLAPVLYQKCIGEKRSLVPFIVFLLQALFFQSSEDSSMSFFPL